MVEAQARPMEAEAGDPFLKASRETRLRGVDMPPVSKAMVDQLIADVKAELPPGTVFSFPLLTVFLTRCHQIFCWVASVAARGGPARQGWSISELGLWGHILDEFLPFISDDGGGDSREMFETLRYAASAERDQILAVEKGAARRSGRRRRATTRGGEREGQGKVCRRSGGKYGARGNGWHGS